MRPDRRDHPRRIPQRPEVTGRSISGRNFNLSDDSACARCANDERRFRLIPVALMWHEVEQRSADTAKPALRVADRPPGTPGDGPGRNCVGDAAVQRHRRPTTTSRTDDEIGTCQRSQQCRQTGRIVLIVRVDRDDRLDARLDRRQPRETAHEGRTLAAIDVMSEHVIRAALDRSRRRGVP